jgi:hypothetical protein
VGPGFHDRFAIVRVDAANPELGIVEPAADRKPEDLFGALTHECKTASIELRLPEDCAGLLDQIPVTFLSRADCFAQHDRLRLFAFGDVERNALQKERATDIILDEAGFPANPDDSTIAGNKPALGTKGSPGPTAASKFLVPNGPVVRVQLRVPEERVLQPLFLTESEKRLDMRADVHLVLALAQDGHEGHCRNLFKKGSVSQLCGPELIDRTLLGGLLQRSGSGLRFVPVSFPTELIDRASARGKEGGRKRRQNRFGSVRRKRFELREQIRIAFGRGIVARVH